jgi:hypothetical protein
MHLRIDSHSGFAKGPAQPARDSSLMISGGYAGCPCNLSYETTSLSQRKRSLYALLNDDLGLSQIPYSNQNSRMHIDPHISQPTECRPNPFVTFALSHPFSIDLFDASERKHSPPSEPKCKNTFLERSRHALMQSPDLGHNQAFLQNQQHHSFHNQISFNS